jgi:hypothetical protein
LLIELKFETTFVVVSTSKYPLCESGTKIAVVNPKYKVTTTISTTVVCNGPEINVPSELNL